MAKTIKKDPRVFPQQGTIMEPVLGTSPLPPNFKEKLAEQNKKETPKINEADLTYGEKMAYYARMGLSSPFTGKQVKQEFTPRVQELLGQTRGSKENIRLEQQNLMASTGVQITPDGRQIIGEGGVVENIATGGAALAGGITGAKFGAAAGTLIAPGIGTLIGGVVGGIGGAIGGAYIKLKIQKLQDIKEANKFFTQAKTNKQEILNFIDAGLVTEGQARELWQEEKQNIYAAHNYLKRQTQSDLKSFLGRPGDDLIAIESYLTLDRFYDLEFEKALIQPDPSKIRFMNEGEE